MDKILERIIAIIGWKRAMRVSWGAIKPKLEKAAAKTETSFDDELVKILDEIILSVINDKVEDDSMEAA